MFEKKLFLIATNLLLCSSAFAQDVSAVGGGSACVVGHVYCDQDGAGECHKVIGCNSGSAITCSFKKPATDCHKANVWDQGKAQ